MSVNETGKKSKNIPLPTEASFGRVFSIFFIIIAIIQYRIELINRFCSGVFDAALARDLL